MSARFIPAGALALLRIISSAESQSFQRIALTSCRLPGVDGEARCGSYEVYEDRGARKGRRVALKIAVLPALGSKPAPDALFILAGGPGSEVVFFLKESPALFLFIRNDKGQVAQMLTIQDRRVTAGKKIK